MATGYDIDFNCKRLGEIIAQIIDILYENEHLVGFISGSGGRRAARNLDIYLTVELNGDDVDERLIYLKEEYERIRNEMEMLLIEFEEDHDDDDEAEEFYEKLEKCLSKYSPNIIESVKKKIGRKKVHASRHRAYQRRRRNRR